MISISGLTAKQRVLMDVMWAMESLSAVNAFIATLPTRDQQDCRSLMAIAVQETLEQDGGIADYEADALGVIAGCR